MRYIPATHEKLNSAYELLQGGTISLDAFSQVITLLKGLHPELDKKLAVSSELLNKLQKIQSGDIIALSADALPEETEEDKKRKKALIFFINSINNLKSEIKRVQTELNKTDTSSNSFDKIVYGAKGPFGIITIVAVMIVGISLFVMPKNNTARQHSLVPTPAVQTGRTNMKIIIFNGKSIPVTEFYIGHGPDCGGGGVPHYHAPNETTVKALDGTILQDPGGCGFGKVKDTQVVEIAITPTP